MSQPSGQYRPPTFDPPPIRQQSWTTYGAPPPPLPPEVERFFSAEPPHPKTPWYRRGWVIGLGMFVFGLGIGGAMTQEVTTDTGAQAPTAQSKTSPAAKSKTSPAAKEATAAPRGLAGDGTYLVGLDIQAGTYRSKGGDLCYWARLKRTDGELTSIIANHAGPGAQIVTIKSTDKAFETRGCSDWALSK